MKPKPERNFCKYYKPFGAFTETILKLSDDDIEIIEIGGNDEIVVSILAEKSQQIEFENMELLHESAVVTNKNITRKVCHLHVSELLNFIRYSKQNSIEVEHVFDY